MMLSRWAISLVGTALLGGVLWWFGPLWPPLEPALPRIAGVQGLVLLWVIGNVALDARKRRRSTALTAGLSEAGEERAAIGQSFERALSLLGKQGRAALTDLPWYAIIGPPGAGKTTALLNAGLTFPLAAELGRAPVPGVGGTRLCDWWFTDKAVLIDTAGRYTTQDSDAAVDRAGWSAFLTLLKRTRPAQPLNGVIVAIGVPDVVQATPAERDAHAAAIARRLAELEQAFGVRLPVYGLFTKADLVAGFTEFFDDLDAEGRDQVWGETFPLAPAKPERFAETFRALTQRVGARMLGRIAAEARTDRRPAIAGFPAQLASMTPALAGFASAALGQGMLRGLYLASGTQEGTPIDRLAGTMSRAFGLPASRVAAMQSGQGRSYFLGRLLRGVIFGEAMLVRRNPALARRRFLLRTAGFGIVAILLAAAAGGILWSARQGGAQLDPAAEALAGYTRDAGAVAADTVTDGDLRPLIPLLDHARALPGTLPPDSVPLGMDQSAKLSAGAQVVYRNGLIYGLLPRLLWRLEAEMRGALPEPERLYELLRVYLMLGGAGPMDAAAVRAWFSHAADPDDAALLTQALPHVDALLADPLPTVSLDGPLVEAARASIERVSPAARVYATLRSSAAAAALPPWRPVDSLGLAGVGLFSRASGAPLSDPIPGLFTAAGFRTVLLAALPAASRQVGAESWVVGRTTEAVPVAQVERGVKALYWAEFTTRWDAMLTDLGIAPIGSLPQAAQALYIIASPESPLRALLRSISTQLRLPPEADPAVAARYAALVGLTSGDGAALERSLRLVADIQQPLAKIAALPVGTALPPGGEDIGTNLQLEAARQPPPLGRWLSTVAATATALRTGDARRQLALLYNAPGGPAQACAAAVTRYPFAATGTPLAEDEFTRLFGPAGTLDGFLNTQLKPYIDTTAEPWKTRSGFALGAADLAQFQRAAAIRAAFFPTGVLTGAQNATVASFPVEVAPTGTPRTATLTLGGVAIASGKGVAHAAIVTWPPPAPGAPEAALASDLAALNFRESGFWALHRLAGRGRLRADGKPGTYLLTFGAPPDAIAYTVRSPVLAPGLLSDFRCPAVQ